MTTELAEGTRDPRGWAERNWKWLVLLLVAGAFVALAALVGLILLIVFGSIRSSDVCASAVAQARAHPDVVRELGEPIEVGWMVSGSIETIGPSGSADLAIPLRGPAGKGTLHATAEKSAGRWTFSVLEMAVEGKSERIDLLVPRVAGGRPKESPRPESGHLSEPGADVGERASFRSSGSDRERRRAPASRPWILPRWCARGRRGTRHRPRSNWARCTSPRD